MLAAVHEDLPVAVNIALEQEIDVSRILNNSPGIRRNARNPCGQTIRFRIVLGLPLIHDRFRRGQQRNRLAGSQALSQISNRSAALPDTRKIRMPIRKARRGTVRRRVARPDSLRIWIRAATRWSRYFSRSQS